MTARGVHAGGHAPDAEDLDVEEVLALVNEGSTGSGEPALPSPQPQGTPQTHTTARHPDTAPHKATPGPRPARSPAAPHAQAPAGPPSP